MEKSFVIMACGGEYDDSWQCPIATAPDMTTALLIAEAIDKQEQPYFDQILSKEFEYLRSYPDLGTHVVEVPFVQI